MNKKITVVTGCNTIITDLNHFLKPDFSKHNFGSWKGSETCARHDVGFEFHTGLSIFEQVISVLPTDVLFLFEMNYFEISYFTISYFKTDFPGKNDPKWPVRLKHISGVVP